MEFENGLSIQEATKAFTKRPQYIQEQANAVFFQHQRIVNSKTGRLLFGDVAHAREVASAVRLLEQMHPDIRRRWNKRELKRLFGIFVTIAAGSLLFVLSDMSGDGIPDIVERLYHWLNPKPSGLVKSPEKPVDPDFIEKTIGLEDNAIEKTFRLPDHSLEKNIASDQSAPPGAKKTEKSLQVKI